MDIANLVWTNAAFKSVDFLANFNSVWSELSQYLRTFRINQVSYQFCRFKLYDFRYTCNKEYANCSLWMNESNGDLIFNERSTFLKDWPPWQINFQLLYTKSLRDDNYMELNNINVDPCMIHKFLSGNFIVRTLLENYEKMSNDKSFGCSIKKVYH
jgi:hypothetical protein